MALPRLRAVILCLLVAAGCASNASPGSQLSGAGGESSRGLPQPDGGTIFAGTDGPLADAGVDAPGAGGVGGASGVGGTSGAGGTSGVGGLGDAGGGRDGGADGPAAGGSVGDKCTGAAMCGPGGVCAADVSGGGYCTADCTASGTCPAGAACVQATDTVKVCFKTCSTSANCRPEHLCSQGYCLPRCASDADCSTNHCIQGTGECGPSRVGNACTRDGDCGQLPAFCDKTRPEGYCSLPCGGANNAGCPDGANCVSAGNGGNCLAACASQSDCRAGFRCANDVAGVGSCVPRCSRDEDCAAGLRCDTVTGACVPGGAVTGTIGGPCAVDGDCAAIGATAYCATVADGFPAGYCSIPCDTTACPMSGVCVATTANTHDCLSPCQVPADCRDGYTCFALASGGQSICFPKCTVDSDCAEPTPVCDLGSGYCEARPVGGGTTTGDTVDLTPNGPVLISDGVVSDRFAVTVPADAVAIEFVGQALSDSTALVDVYRLEQTTNDFATTTRLFDRASLSNSVQVAPPVVAGAFAMLYPNAPSAPFTVSTATVTVKLAIRVQVSQPTTVKLTALIKRASSRALTQGNVDLNLFFVGLAQLDAASAPNDPRFRQIVERVKSTWGKVGVGIGNVSYIDVTGANATRFTDLNENDLGDLMKLSNVPAAKDGALNVFFVNSITGDGLGGYTILGVSAGIPSVPLRGTTGSGMAVTTADFPDGLEDIGDTWAHEGGHALGLFHTTELGGTAFDPLSDTLECPRSPYDTNGDKIMEPQECTARDAGNELFWTSDAAIPHANLTPNQGFVMLRSPAVH